MADQFFSKDTPPAEKSVPSSQDSVKDSATPANPGPPPALDSLPGLAGPAELARSAQQKKRRLLLQLTVAIIVVLVLVIILVWRLTKTETAPNSTTVTTNTNTANNTSNTPTPTLNSQLPGSNSSSANTVGWQAVSMDYVKNLTYPSSTGWTTTNGWTDVPASFKLTNGVAYFEGGWYMMEEQRIIVHLTTFVKDEAIGTGDIDNDGLTDAVLVMKWTDGGTGAFPLLYTIFGSQPNAPVLNNDVLAGVVGGNYSATKVTLSRNTLQLQLNYPQAGDASCCWSGQANLTLKLVGQQWQLAN